MKIYTEVNYDLINDCLVESDSKSYEYEGEVLLCGGTGEEVVEELVEEPMEEAMEALTDPVIEMNEPPPVDEEDRLTGTGTASNVSPLAELAINKKTQGAPGAFTRGSLRVRKPKRIAV